MRLLALQREPPPHHPGKPTGGARPRPHQGRLGDVQSTHHPPKSEMPVRGPASWRYAGVEKGHPSSRRWLPFSRPVRPLESGQSQSAEPSSAALTNRRQTGQRTVRRARGNVVLGSARRVAELASQVANGVRTVGRGEEWSPGDRRTRVGAKSRLVQCVYPRAESKAIHLVARPWPPIAKCPSPNEADVRFGRQNATELLGWRS